MLVAPGVGHDRPVAEARRQDRRRSRRRARQGASGDQRRSEGSEADRGGSPTAGRRAPPRSESDRRRRRPPGRDIGPSSDSRAQASAVMLAAEPPLTRIPADSGRIADPLLEPVEHDELELAGARGRHPRADVDVQRGWRSGPQAPRERARRRDEGKVAGVSEPAHRSEHVVRELVRAARARRGARRAVGRRAGRGDRAGRRGASPGASGR